MRHARQHALVERGVGVADLLQLVCDPRFAKSGLVLGDLDILVSGGLIPQLLQKLGIALPRLTADLEAYLGGGKDKGNAATSPREPAAAAAINRVRHDAGYAAGNLAVMSQRAHLAKAAHGFGTAWATAQALQAQAQAIDAAGPVSRDGLSAAHWSRIAVLCSFVEALPHEQACELPLLVLPPNRLRLFNPAQALQVFISRQLLSAGWSQRINALEALLSGLPAQRAFRSFFQTLLPRVLEAKGAPGAQESRWALEDAWQHPAVLQRWTRFARLLTPAQCEAVMQQATAGHSAPEGVRFESQADAHATEGWCLETRGHVPHQLANDSLGPRAAARAQWLH